MESVLSHFNNLSTTSPLTSNCYYNNHMGTCQFPWVKILPSFMCLVIEIAHPLDFRICAFYKFADVKRLWISSLPSAKNT